LVDVEEDAVAQARDDERAGILAEGERELALALAQLLQGLALDGDVALAPPGGDQHAVLDHADRRVEDAPRPPGAVALERFDVAVAVAAGDERGERGAVLR